MENALNAQARSLGYHVSFNIPNCETGAAYVCDVKASSGNHSFKFLAVSTAKGASVDHFSVPMSVEHTPLALASYSVVSSLIGSNDISLEDATSFLQDEISEAKSSGNSATDPYRGTMQNIAILPGSAVVVTVSYQKD
ncbi:hypothetical protein DTW90_34505 [Neorhizobium sp. P12A]|nr:hypothetical protein DTW90_34505 [Neorhizobium sp. P12A]